mmetsp:Transcript_118029/g.328966  ORF Transcript_118029/g.328966 Transcript_118029/m.328966 type:complete len:385 (-) Transcript_118029:75-1229(-)
MRTGTAVVPGTNSRLASKFDVLQDRAQRKPIHQSTVDFPGDMSKVSIGLLKDFYLQRLAKTEYGGSYGSVTLLGSRLNTSGKEVPSKAGAQAPRPNFAQDQPAPVTDIEDLEVMCNNCFSLIKSSEASQCTGSPSDCPVACRSGEAPAKRPDGPTAVLDLKLTKLRAALEARLQDTSAKINIMRHLTQLRYHIDTALKWSQGCSEIGTITEHTVLQVKQLSTTSRWIAPAVYVFSKRVENAVVQKERELRKELMRQHSPCKGGSYAPEVDPDEMAESVADVNSVVSELDSDCGTTYADTVVTQETPGTDVGNMQDVNDAMTVKSEDEQRRWFYSQCLTAKLACPDKARARKILISELYTRVKAEGVPMDRWVKWIRKQLKPDEE